MSRSARAKVRVGQQGQEQVHGYRQASRGRVHGWEQDSRGRGRSRRNRSAREVGRSRSTEARVGESQQRQG